MYASEEPDTLDETSLDFIDGDCLYNVCSQAGDALVVDDLVACDHSIYHCRVQAGNRESVLRVVLGERCLAREYGRGRGWPEDLDIVSVLGCKALDVVRVVCVQLPLNR